MLSSIDLENSSLLGYEQKNRLKDTSQTYGYTTITPPLQEPV
jgi:hypothetical protein